MGPKTIWNSLVTDSHDHDVEGVGSLRYTDDKVYRYIKNNDTGNTLSAGNCCTHNITDGATMNTAIWKPATANLSAFAGIVASTLLAANSGTLPKRYGWIQVGGPVAVAIKAATLTLGGQPYIATNGQVYASPDFLYTDSKNYATRGLTLAEAFTSSNNTDTGICTIRNCIY